MLFRFGDAVASRNIHAAIYDSPRLCKDFRAGDAGAPGRNNGPVSKSLRAVRIATGRFLRGAQRRGSHMPLHTKRYNNHV